MSNERASRILLSVLVGATLLALRPSQPVWADAAPPARPPGSSVSPGEFVTHVQMVSEEVLLAIEGVDSPAASAWGLAADLMVGHVEAVFVMHNQGQTEEAFDVWFPLGAPDGYSAVTNVENFAAWVDGVPAQIGEEMIRAEWDWIVPWATWPTTFPPGQDVVLRVTYDVLPDGYSPYGSFPYILETGAGWWGAIGEGTITFRLPYAVNKSNTVLNPDAYGGQPVWMAPSSPDFSVAGTDVVWRFTDLEPDAGDNIELTVLSPGVWNAIVAARAAAADNPDDAAAHMRLVRALNGALRFKYGLEPIGDSPALAQEAEAAYLRALELAPQDVEIYVEYLEWLRGFPEPGLPVLRENMRPVLERALVLAPDDERLREIQRWVDQIEPYLVTPTPSPPPTAPLSATPSATAAATPTSPPTDTPVPTASATSAPTPTASATATPTATLPPPPSATTAPTQAPESGGGGICPGTLAMALVPLGWMGVARGQRRQRRAKKKP